MSLEADPSPEYWLSVYPDGRMSYGAFTYEMEQTKRRRALIGQGMDAGERVPPTAAQLDGWELEYNFRK